MAFPGAELPGASNPLTRPGRAAATAAARRTIGAYHTCARTSIGAAQCRGEKTYGALGDGTTTNSSTPVAVSGLTVHMRSRDAGATDGPLPSSRTRPGHPGHRGRRVRRLPDALLGRRSGVVDDRVLVWRDQLR